VKADSKAAVTKPVPSIGQAFHCRIRIKINVDTDASVAVFLDKQAYICFVIAYNSVVFFSFKVSRNGLVDVVNRLEVRGIVVRFPTGARSLSLFQSTQTDSGGHPAFHSTDPAAGGLFLRE